MAAPSARSLGEESGLSDGELDKLLKPDEMTEPGLGKGGGGGG